ncbi:uncharacterized protein LOC103793610 [Callithrix jacchus]
MSSPRHGLGVATAPRGAASAWPTRPPARSSASPAVLDVLDEHDDAVVEALQLLLVSADDLVLVGVRRRPGSVPAVRTPAAGDRPGGGRATRLRSRRWRRPHCSGTATASGSHPRGRPRRREQTGGSRPRTP